MSSPRGWDKELAAIDRAIERAPAATVGTPAASPRYPGPPVVRGTARHVWARLVPVLALALPFWPYPHLCGLGLALYLSAVVTLVGASMWAAASTC